MRTDKKLIEKIQKDICAFYDKFGHNVELYKERTKQVMGKQWDDVDERAFKARGKRPMTFNKLHAIVNNIIGEYIRITPAMQVVAVTANQDKIVDDIEVAQNLFKTISMSSDAKNQYREAAKCAARGGYGVLRVSTRYEDYDSFNQEITVSAFPDPTVCFFDVNAKEQTKGDGAFCGYYKVMARKSFESKYPKVDLNDCKGVSIDGVDLSWVSTDSVVIVNYYEKVKKSTELYRIEGSEILDDGNYLDSELRQSFSVEQIKSLPIVKRRKTQTCVVKHYKVAGDAVLEEEEFPCDELPLVFVDQESFIVDGKQTTRSIVEDAIDSQNSLNFVGSQSIHLVKMQRNDQWLATKKNIEGNEHIWREPDKIQGVLTFEHDPDNPNGPREIAPVPINPSLLQQYQRLENDIHTTTGIYPTQLGNQGNEISGRAIQQRAEQANIANVSFFVNVNSAIAQAGKIILKMLPKIYDSYRIVSIMNSLGSVKATEINKPDGFYGIRNNIKATKYALSVDASLSFEAQKQQALESLQMVLQANPQMFQLIADLYAENLPLSNNMEISNRLKTIVPKDVIAAGKGEPPPPPQPQPPDPQQMMMQMKMQSEMAKVQNQQQTNQLKNQQLQVDREKMQQESVQNYTNAQIAQIKAAAEILNAVLTHKDAQHERALRLTEHAIKHSGFIKPTDKTLGEEYGRE